MNHIRSIAVLAVLLLGASEVLAQAGGIVIGPGGDGGGAKPGELPKDLLAEPNAVCQGESIALRFFEKPSDRLKAALEAVAGVKDVAIDEERYRVALQYTGRIDLLQTITQAASKAGTPLTFISPARVSIEIRFVKDPIPRLEDLRNALAGGEGVRLVRFPPKLEKEQQSTPAKRPTTDPFNAEIYVNLDLFTMEGVAGLEKRFALQLRLLSHEGIVIMSKGNLEALKTELRPVRGTLTFKRKDDTLTCWALRPVADVALYGAAEKAGVKIDRIQRKR